MQHDISRGTPPGDLELHMRDEVTSQHLQLVGSAWSPKLPQAHLSPLGVIPKKGRPNCWRLIMDLSSPHGHSINDGIAKKLRIHRRCSREDHEVRYGTAQFKLQARKWTARVHFVVRYMCFSKSCVSVGQCTEIFRPIYARVPSGSVHVYSCTHVKKFRLLRVTL